QRRPAVDQEVTVRVAAGVVLPTEAACLAAVGRSVQLLPRQTTQLVVDRAQLVVQRLHLVVELELAQRGREQVREALGRLRTGVPEVEHRVVPERERALDRQQLAGTDRDRLLGGDPRGVRDDRDTPRVEPAPTCAPGELLVLVRRQRATRFAVELGQLADDHGLGRHVDAERQRVGREDDLQEPAVEQLLYQHLQYRQHTGVVEADAQRQQPRQRADLVERTVI